MTAPLPKRFGYKLPLEALGGACIRVSIEFPDKLEYRAAYSGAINMLGKWFQWDHTQADYADIPDLNVEVAQVWSEVLAAATWEECVEFCARIIECLASDEDVKAAFRNFILTDPAINEHMQTTAKEGVPLTMPQIEAPIGENCDLDTMYGGVIALIEAMHNNNLDFLQLIEVETGTLERVDEIISAIPIIETIPVDEIIAFADRFFNEILENYEAQITSDLLTEYRCNLFCMIKARENCIITLDDLYTYWRDRLEMAFTTESALSVVIEALADGSYSGTLIADFMFMMQIQLIRSANDFAGVDLGEFQTFVSIGMLTPSAAWEIECEDCPPDPPPGDCWDFTASQDGWVILTTYGNWSAGGFTKDVASNDLIIELEITEPVVTITVTFDAPVANVQIRALAAYSYAALADNSATSQSVHVITITGDGSHGMGIWVDNISGSQRLIGVCVEIAP